MSEAIVVHRGVSRYGMHQLHMIQSGKALDQEAVWAQICKEAAARQQRAELKAKLEYTEAEIGMNHLRLYWKETGNANG